MSRLFPEPTYLSVLHKKKEPPKPKDGEKGDKGDRGEDVDYDKVLEIVRAEVAKIPRPKDGKDVDTALVLETIRREVAKIPRPKDGASVDRKQVVAMVAAEVAKIPKPKDGQDFTPPDGVEDFDIESGHLVKRYRNGNVVALKLPRQVRGGGTSRQTVKGIALAASGEKSVRITATDTSITTADDILIVTATATITMPTAVGSTKTYKIKRSGSGDVTVVGTSGQTVEGETSRIINVNLYALELHSDGSNWVEL